MIYTCFNWNIEQQIVFLTLAVSALLYNCPLTIHNHSEHSLWRGVKKKKPNITFLQNPQRHIALMPIKGEIWAHFIKHLL